MGSSKRKRGRMEILMKIKNVSVNAGKKKILKSLFFEIYREEFLGIIGESASGKTTLLHLLGGFLSANFFQMKGEIAYSKEKKPRSYMILQDAIHSLNPRSEEHTSELQSRQYLVCRLLLEKNHAHPLLSTLLPTHT